jgi:hypothetical protein
MKKGLVIIGTAFVIHVFLLAGCGRQAVEGQLSDLGVQLEAYQNQVDDLQDMVTRLSYNTASGGGVNLKMMPNPDTGEPTVPLEEVFSFDRNHAFCRVDSNPHAFRMPTYRMGEVVVEPHQFFMSMVVTSIEQYEIVTDSNGTRRVVMRGGLDCATEVGQADVTIGSRTAAEHATYKIEAVDRGVGGGEAGDTFAFTVFFDPEEAPVNYGIFGPEFTFTGTMVAGEITVIDPDVDN